MVPTLREVDGDLLVTLNAEQVKNAYSMCHNIPCPKPHFGDTAQHGTSDAVPPVSNANEDLKQ
jgi:hypothetical protein